MSSRDHDLEQSGAADEPAISIPASPPRRDPVEDADASFTRKRPRLDNGDESLRNMSPQPRTPVNSAEQAADNLVEMTIRSHPPSSPVHAAHQQSPIAIPNSDDEAASPPVVVIDDDDEPVHFAVQLSADDHFRQFPFARLGNYSQVVRELTQHVHTVPSMDPNFLPAIERWLLDVPDPSADLDGFFVSKAAFWEEFASFVNKLLVRRYQWLNAFNTNNNSDVCRAPFGDQFDDLRADELFCRFFSAYIRVSVFLVQADLDLLSRPRATELYLSSLLSYKHLRHLNSLLRAEKTQLFHILHKDYGIDTRAVSNRLHKVFLKNRGAQSLHRLANEAFHQVPISAHNHIAANISQLLSIVGWSVYECSAETGYPDRHEYSRATLLIINKYSADLYDLSKTTDAGIARDLTQYLSTLLSDVCQWSEPIATELADKFLDFRDPESPTLSSSSEGTAAAKFLEYRQSPLAFPALVSNAWKFKLLRKYLVKGKMDLRVMSIATMDAALVEIWREYSNLDQTCRHPVMQHLADFLLHGQVVDYIISVDSHPQLISRSGNIVGFLVVTHRWSDGQADAIWRTVSTSPDPRVVAATMTMLRGIIILMAPPDQLYLCQKLHDLPLERFTLDILRFLKDLTMKLLDRAPSIDWTSREFSARPWNVCIRMLRDTAPNIEADKNMLDLHNEAADQLRGLAHVVPLEDRHTIYRDCAQHIAARSKEATGSVKAIHILASSPYPGDGVFFQQNQELARQILEEIPAFVDSESKSGSQLCQVLALRNRLELLALLIYGAGNVVPTDLYEPLWDHTIGMKAISNDARNLAWAQLFQTIKYSPENDFCKELVNTYLSKLDPKIYTIGLFEFVSNYNYPTNRAKTSTEEGEKMVIQIPGAEMLWSMLLFAPKGTIEDRAARLLAARYVQIKDSPGVTLSEVELAHTILVEKCMKEMRSAFAVLRTMDQDSESTKEAMVTNETREENEARFGRVLLFQKVLLEYVRGKPDFNRGRRTDSKIDEMDIPKGDAIAIKYQCGNDRQTVMMAADHTLEDLHRRLCHATGFTKINLFAKGHRLKIAGNATEKLADVDFGGQLLIQRAEGAEVTRHSSSPVSGFSVFETTVLKHFDELFALMDSDDTISQQLFNFLSYFPARNTFAESVMNDLASSETLFPVGKFFQARYAAQALQSRLREHIRNSSLNENFLASVIRHLDEALLNPNLISDPVASFQELQLAAVLVNVLLEFLRERPSPEISATYFSNGSALAERLMKILSVALETNDDAAVIQDLYAVILESSLHSRDIWDAFVNNSDTHRLHQILLLNDSQRPLREQIAKKIASVCGGDLPSTCPVTKGEIASRFWAIISSILPEALRYSESSQQLFEIAEHVFRANDAYDHNEASLRSYLTQWGGLLLQHEHQEFVGRDEIDHVVLGFTNLLLCCVLSIKSFKKPVNADTLLRDVFNKYVFIRNTRTRSATSRTEVDTHPSALPVLESYTRQKLYDLLIALAEDKKSYNTLLMLASEVENSDQESGLPAVSVDRSMEIRSSTGYVGLYNPRAICYMNSLLTQLFMNLNFRSFMLSLEVQEAGASQKLLFETQRLFTQMQHSYRRSTDPRSFAACVRNLEQLPIDISIQMDADEFYNLLFDQWEAQLVKEEHKQQFRSFYGGQTLTQIKSKECKHVSERAEPFFAVQCDVQGKASLQESLEAFVHGDVMEGDNKYKCESCGGKFVDAVKRTCFKEVPDNMIFHLKRFEFDLNDFSRRKIYDHFEFPPSIDISAYHVDHLSDPKKPREPDMFDLVGVLVHTGNCENGHYYSYIRERPCPTEGATPTWIEFDDSNVSPFDPADISQKAFGGLLEDGYGRTMKNFSAYMLFYQRRTAVENDQKVWVTNANRQTSKVQVPEAIRKEVDVNNENFIREYCLFDPSHSRFIRQLHATARTINHGACSEDHEQEKSSIPTILTHLWQIVWRHQSTEIFAETLQQIRRYALTCSECCSIVLKLIALDDFSLYNLLLRNIHPKLRAQTRTFLIDCLKFYREKEPSLYAPEATDSDMELDVSDDNILQMVVKRLKDTAIEGYLSTRGWDDLYLTLTQVVEMGQIETAVVLNHGLLEFCLKLFTLHCNKHFKEEYQDLSRMMEKRRGITNRLIGFVCTLLLRMDIRLPVTTRGDDRYAPTDREVRFPLNQRERHILLFWSEELKGIVIVDKILELFDHGKTDYFYPGEIIKWMLESLEPQIQTNVAKTIIEGTTLEPLYCDTYMRAALSFCEGCPISENISKVFTAVSKAITSQTRMDEERAPSGDAVLGFYAGLFSAENETYFAQKNSRFAFHHLLMAKCPAYIMPLLTHHHENVRKGAQAFLHELYANSLELPSETAAVKWKTMRTLVADMNARIIFEKDAGVLRSSLDPLISICQVLIQSIWYLSQSEDEDKQQYMDDGDATLIYQYQTEVEPRLRLWPLDDGTEVSEGGGFDGQSDYGSESDGDDGEALLEIN